MAIKIEEVTNEIVFRTFYSRHFGQNNQEQYMRLLKTTHIP